jgi:dipeptidase E
MDAPLRRLVLYSDQIPPITDPIDAAFLRWLRPGDTIGYVPSAPDPERVWFTPRQAYYARYGLDLRFFGLEDEYDPAQRAALLACDAIHLTGGNTFRFLYWLRERGLDADLHRYALDGGVLLGVSAGAILMTPDIRTSLLCGDTLYPGLTDFTGLALVDFAVVPHVTEVALPGPAYAIPDGAGIVIDGDCIELFGGVRPL